MKALKQLQDINILTSDEYAHTAKLALLAKLAITSFLHTTDMSKKKNCFIVLSVISGKKRDYLKRLYNKNDTHDFHTIADDCLESLETLLPNFNKR